MDEIVDEPGLDQEVVENLAREIFNRRTQRRVPIDDAAWLRRDKLFPQSQWMLRDEAARMILDGELDD